MRFFGWIVVLFIGWRIVDRLVNQRIQPPPLLPKGRAL